MYSTNLAAATATGCMDGWRNGRWFNHVVSESQFTLRYIYKGLDTSHTMPCYVTYS